MFARERLTEKEIYLSFCVHSSRQSHLQINLISIKHWFKCLLRKVMYLAWANKSLLPSDDETIECELSPLKKSQCSYTIYFNYILLLLISNINYTEASNKDAKNNSHAFT